MPLFWNQDRPPRLSEAAGVLVRFSGLGAALGSVIALLIRPEPDWSQNPAAYLAANAYAGACFSSSFCVFAALPWPYLRPILIDVPRRFKWVLIALIGSAGCTLAFAVASALVNLVPGAHFPTTDHFGATLIVEAVLGAIIALIVGTIKTLKADLRATELREATLAEAAAKAQAAALQAQINPHFFFNTLNTLAALIPQDPAAAQEIVGRLADMFRYTMACTRTEKVTLAQELAFVENYLKLEQARFSRRLTVMLPGAGYEDILLPGLSLQPLVENAVRYGIAQLIEGGTVEVAVHRNGVGCSIDVFSPAAGEIEPGRFFRDGHALANVRDRLRLHSGEKAGVDVATESDARVRVSLILPREAK
jgi:hypothetical protein